MIGPHRPDGAVAEGTQPIGPVSQKTGSSLGTVPENREGRVDVVPPDEYLADAVPATARTVLQCGAGTGWIASRLKQRHPGRVVYGTDFPGRSPGPATRAGARGAPGFDDLDGYHEVDLERALPPLEAGSVDCIVYADVAAPLRRSPGRPGATDRALLSDDGDGAVLGSQPAASRDRGGDPAWPVPLHPRHPPRPLLRPALHRRRASCSSSSTPATPRHTVGRVEDDGAADVRGGAGAPLFELLGVGAGDAERDLRTSRLIVRGSPLAPSEASDEVPLTFVACVNDEAQLDANLRRSPCLRGRAPSRVARLPRTAPARRKGSTPGSSRPATNSSSSCTRTCTCPRGGRLAWWPNGDRPSAPAGPIGIAGVFGVLDRRVPFDAIGHVVHRDRLLTHRSLPSDVDGLDELLMVVPRDTPLRVEAALGWHLYGTDLALQAQQRALRVVVLDAPCHHNSLTGRVPWKYRESERVLAQKWADLLPIHTNLSSIDAWLTDADAPGGAAGSAGPAGSDGPVEDTGAAPAEVAELVARLRREQLSLNHELEQARLQVASMQAEPVLAGPPGRTWRSGNGWRGAGEARRVGAVERGHADAQPRRRGRAGGRVGAVPGRRESRARHRRRQLHRRHPRRPRPAGGPGPAACGSCAPTRPSGRAWPATGAWPWRAASSWRSATTTTPGSPASAGVITDFLDRHPDVVAASSWHVVLHADSGGAAVFRGPARVRAASSCCGRTSWRCPSPCCVGTPCTSRSASTPTFPRARTGTCGCAAPATGAVRTVPHVGYLYTQHGGSRVTRTADGQVVGRRNFLAKHGAAMSGACRLFHETVLAGYEHGRGAMARAPRPRAGSLRARQRHRRCPPGDQLRRGPSRATAP